MANKEIIKNNEVTATIATTATKKDTRKKRVATVTKKETTATADSVKLSTVKDSKEGVKKMLICVPSQDKQTGDISYKNIEIVVSKRIKSGMELTACKVVTAKVLQYMEQNTTATIDAIKKQIATLTDDYVGQELPSDVQQKVDALNAGKEQLAKFKKAIQASRRNNKLSELTAVQLSDKVCGVIALALTGQELDNDVSAVKTALCPLVSVQRDVMERFYDGQSIDKADDTIMCQIKSAKSAIGALTNLYSDETELCKVFKFSCKPSDLYDFVTWSSTPEYKRGVVRNTKLDDKDKSLSKMFANYLVNVWDNTGETVVK